MSWLISRALMEDYANSHSLPALVEEFSAASCSGGEPFVPSSVSPTPQAYLSPDRTTAFSRLSRFGMTFAPLTDNLGEALLKWCRADFRARTFQPPEKAQESTENDPACGGRWRELSVKYDRNTSSWKTHRCLWAEDLPECSVTLPRWGLMRGGVLSELATLEHRTGAKESGLWPTPNAMPATSDLGFQCSGDGRKKPNKLGWAVAQQMYPTPLATNTKANHMRSGGRPARSYWPTPKANDAENRGNFDTSNPRNGLPAAAKSWPMPTVNDSKNSTLPPSQVRHDNIAGALLRSGQQPGGQLNPTWVEWLMNWPINWTSLESLEREHFEYWQEKSAAGVSDCGGRQVRALWFDQDPSETPYRPRSNEQRAGQHRTTMRGLPCETTQDNPACDLPNLRAGVSAETQQESNALRGCAMPEREGETISRVALGVTARVDRLKAIGNGQVPAVAAAAWRMLTNNK